MKNRKTLVLLTVLLLLATLGPASPNNLPGARSYVRASCWM